MGEPILLTTHPVRYKVFFYFNSAAFVASLVIVVMLQKTNLVRRGHALLVALILDFFGLIGAYAAGSCRDTSTTIYTVAMAGAVLIYVVIHIVFFTLDNGSNNEGELERKRALLLLLAILAATTTTKILICPGWETFFVPVSQPGTPCRDKRRNPFVPGLATGTKDTLLSRLVIPIGTKCFFSIPRRSSAPPAPPSSSSNSNHSITKTC